MVLIVAKGFLKLPNLLMLISQKNLSLPRNLDFMSLGELLIVFSTKVNLPYLVYSTAPEVLSSAFDKAKLLNFFLKANLYVSGMFLPTFSSRNNLKLHNLPLTFKLV